MARLLVEVTRGDRVESRHRGSIAVVSSSGELSSSFGDADEFAFIRSSAKPFQLAPFVASGRFDAYDFPNPTESLAIMAASHSGEDRHVRTVQAVLRAGGLTRDVLACGVHPPFDTETAQRLIRDGEPLTPLRHNCSGKHAAMALHAKAVGWPIETYWQPDHPVQQLALDMVALMSGIARSEIVTATDGCGVMSFGLPLRGLALAFARLADPSSVPDPEMRSAFERIRDAMMAHPELVAGERRRLDTALMRAAPARLVAKAGAEGVQAVGVLAGFDASSTAAGLALKIEDGDSSNRARNVATCAALRRLGVLDDQALERVAEYASPPVLDPRGMPAGTMRSVFELATA
ncbi:MAG: asparaginase [Chloroflexi bacterium]|nr:asparaginase [Chloroflexota bacterium]